MNLSLHIGAIKAGDHRILQRMQCCAQRAVRHGCLQSSLFVKTDAPGRINKRKSQIRRKNAGIQILSTADNLIFFRILCQMLPDDADLFIKRECKIQAGHDLIKPLFYLKEF